MKKIRILWILIPVLFLSACLVQSTVPPVQNEIHPGLTNIPVYSESSSWMDGIPGVHQPTNELKTYSYVAKAFKSETLVEFYEEKMPENGWELLQKNEDSKTKSVGLMFTRSKTVAHIQIVSRSLNSYLVTVVFYDDP